MSLVPAPFRPLLAGALEKDPKKRTPSMGKLLADFRQAQSGGPMPVTPSRPPGFATYPNVPASGFGPAINIHTSQPGPAVAAVQPGLCASSLADLFGANPSTVQSWISTLLRGGLTITSILVGIVLLIMLTGGVVPLVVVLMGFTICAMLAVPTGLAALLVSPDLRHRLWTRISPNRAHVPNGSARPGASVAPSPPPVPVAVPVRQVVAASPAPPVPEIRLDRTSQRLAELSSSLSWATVLAIVFAAGTGFLSPLFGDTGRLHPDLGKLGVFTFTTLLAVWSILIVSKFTTNNRISNRHRRVINLAAGVFVGSAAWWLSRVLMVDLLLGGVEYNAFVLALGRQPLVANHEPTWLGFVIFFGLLFSARQWWRQADANRPAMFRVSAVVGTVIVAAILPVVFAFPWDWAVTWAAVTSCVVQLSAAWIPPEIREQSGRHNLRGSA